MIDLKKIQTMTNDQQLSKCRWTPFHGTEIQGWPVMSMVNGNIVYKDGEILEAPGGMLVEHED